MSLEIFSIVDKNPNDDVGGGGCLCSPSQKVGSCQGPYIVFQKAEVAGPPDAGIHNSPHAVLSVACAHAAYKRTGGEVLASGESATRSAGRADVPDLDWQDLSDRHRDELQAQFPKGGLTKLPSGRRVDVPPAEDPSINALAAALNSWDDPEAHLRENQSFLGATENLPLEEPSTKPGETVPATPDLADEPKPAPLDESEPELEL